MEPTYSKQAKVALTFANALVRGSYEDAYQMLSISLQEELSLEALKETYEGMIKYFDTPPDYTELINDVWQYEDPDIYWAYVSIGSDGYLEAVTVAMTQEDEHIIINEIDWGRP